MEIAAQNKCTRRFPALFDDPEESPQYRTLLISFEQLKSAYRPLISCCSEGEIFLYPEVTERIQGLLDQLVTETRNLLLKLEREHGDDTALDAHLTELVQASGLLQVRIHSASQTLSLKERTGKRSISPIPADQLMKLLDQVEERIADYSLPEDSPAEIPTINLDKLMPSVYGT